MSCKKPKISFYNNLLDVKISTFNDLQSGASQKDLTRFANGKPLSQLKQVHGTKVKNITSVDTSNMLLEADAMITNLKNVYLAIKTADCIPILLFDQKKNVIAAIHSGWRGTKNGIVKNTISKMIDCYNTNPKDLSALIGPGINPCCYEVQKDLVDAFEDTKYAIQTVNNKTFLNLKAVIKNDLASLGVNKIENIGTCTCCTPDLYPSYRRDKTDQRIFSIISIK